MTHMYRFRRKDGKVYGDWSPWRGCNGAAVTHMKEDHGWGDDILEVKSKEDIENENEGLPG